MKKLLLTLASISLMTTTQADTNGELLLSGEVLVNLSIEFTPAILASGLDLASTGTQRVGSINIKSNSSSGYTVDFSSTHLGYMVSGNSGQRRIPYKIQRADDGYKLIDGENYMNSISNRNSGSENLTIDLDFVSWGYMASEGGSGINMLVEGVYTDTLTAIIRAN